MAVAAMRTKNNVFLAQMCTNADGDGLLTDISMASAVNQAALVRAGQLLLALADELHLAVEMQEKIGARTWLRLAATHGLVPSRCPWCRRHSGRGCRRRAGLTRP